MRNTLDAVSAARLVRQLTWAAIIAAVGCGTDGSSVVAGTTTSESQSQSESASPSSSPAVPDGTVSIQLRELTITPNPASAPAGETTFAVENLGEFRHEFIVARLEPETTELPTKFNGAARENGKGFELVGRVSPKDLQSGEFAELTVDLRTGDYVLFCNIVVGTGVAGPIESHYGAGMRTSFVVT
jgi:uncharacterized cupredoxin-like copper-binding protein